MARNARIAVALVALFAGWTSFSQAALFTKLGPGYTLDQLLDGQTTIRAGDKVFSDFSVTESGNVVAPSAITIEPISLNGEFGLHIVGPWTAFGSQMNDTAFSYEVTADSPNEISGATLWAPGAAAVGAGSVAIVENIFATVPGQSLTSLLVSSSAAGNQLLATGSFEPAQSFVFAFKDVIVQGGGTGAGILSEFFQTFQQDSTPEPATLGLLALGAIAMLKRRSR